MLYNVIICYIYIYIYIYIKDIHKTLKRIGNIPFLSYLNICKIFKFLYFTQLHFNFTAHIIIHSF